MKQPFKQQIIALVAATQDGNTITDNGTFSTFIRTLIENNTKDETDTVDVESLASDLRYMIDQLKAALVPIDNINKYIIAG